MVEIRYYSIAAARHTIASCYFSRISFSIDVLKLWNEWKLFPVFYIEDILSQHISGQGNQGVINKMHVFCMGFKAYRDTHTNTHTILKQYAAIKMNKNYATRFRVKWFRLIHINARMLKTSICCFDVECICNICDRVVCV